MLLHLIQPPVVCCARDIFLYGMLTTFPQRKFSLEFPEILSQNHIGSRCLSVSGISKILHCGILTNILC